MAKKSKKRCKHCKRLLVNTGGTWRCMHCESRKHMSDGGKPHLYELPSFFW